MLQYQITKEALLLDQITRPGRDGEQSTHCDFYDIDFTVEGMKSRRFVMTYGRYPNGERTSVELYERNVPVENTYHLFYPVSPDLDVDYASLEKLVREKGEAAFSKTPDSDTRLRKHKAKFARNTPSDE